MQLRNILLAGILTGSPVYAAHAAVTAAQAQQLGTTLTKFGAIQAATADGAVPAYTGGIATMSNLPAASTDIGYTDPFNSEQPLFTVSSANMSQYADMLEPGEQALLQRYPDFHMDVYPTHRTFSYPTWVLDNTVKNATTAQMVGDSDGVTAAYGGIPFPIPQTGAEVMWNGFLAYHSPYCTERAEGYLVDTSGSVTELGTIAFKIVTPYYDQASTVLNSNFWKYYEVRYYAPAAEAGNLVLFQYPIDFTKSDDVTWFYTPGTRRVRLAPEFKYDTPIANYGGAINYDMISLFYGRMDKFDFHLVGEKEMIVPYNDYKLSDTSTSASLGPHFVNPDVIRWERHRVWVVDAELKPGERHIFSRWTFYVDEDSWNILASVSYDHTGAVYKVGFGYPYQDYTDGDATNFADAYSFNDLSKGVYNLSNIHTEAGGNYTCSMTIPSMSNFTPQAMAAEAIR